MAILAQASAPNEKPEQPQILTIIRESRLFNVPFWDAPLLQWPYLLKLEANECYRAEHDHTSMVNFNLTQRAQVLEKSLKTNG